MIAVDGRGATPSVHNVQDLLVFFCSLVACDLGKDFSELVRKHMQRIPLRPILRYGGALVNGLLYCTIQYNTTVQLSSQEGIEAPTFDRLEQQFTPVPTGVPRPAASQSGGAFT
jgi:hypothetical protein